MTDTSADTSLQLPAAALDGAYDVAIVGAGPAGSAAAIVLARAGARVALLERARFPRDKTCGDGLSDDAQQALARLGVAEAIGARAHCVPRAEVTAPGGTLLTVDGPFWTLRRAQFDMELARAAVDAGAKFAHSQFVHLETDLDPNAPVVLRRAEGAPVRARFVIVATGGASRLSRVLRLVDDTKPTTVALRGYVKLDDPGDAAAARKRVTASAPPLDDALYATFHRGVSPGYAWIFPMGGGLYNVGVLAYARHARRGSPTLTERMDAFIAGDERARALFARGRFLHRPQAAAMSTAFAGVRAFARGPVLGAGDSIAAGYPMMAAGVGAALESGIIAAETLLTAPGGLATPGDHDALANAYRDILRTRFAGLHRGFLIAERWLSHPWLTDLLARRIASKARLQRGLGRVVRLEQSAEVLFTWRTVVKSVFG